MEKQLKALTATRGFAALLVVIFHFGTDIRPFSYFEQFFTGGNFAVSYFFVLSGFVMYWTYHNRHISFGNFIKRRIARIAPLYWFALLLSMIAPVYYYKVYHNPPIDAEVVKSLLLNVFFLQGYFPKYSLSINSPGWSLSVEMFFYILFPVLLVIAKRNIRMFLIAGTTFFLLSQMAHVAMVNHMPSADNEAHNLIFYHPLFHLNEFIIGMMGGYYFTICDVRKVRLSSLLAFIVIVLLINFLPRTISLHNGLLAPFFLVLIIALALNEPPALTTRPLLFFGEISYGIYLLQFPVHYYISLWNGLYWKLSAVKEFYLMLATLFLLATISFYLIEKPMRNKINSIHIR